jgi:hypothetical protein
MDVPEAPLKQTDEGLVPDGAGWFVLNARDARWRSRPGRQSVSLTGSDEWTADTLFPMLGVNLAVLEPGEPNSIYHWETETEAFVHCPPKTEHVIVGAGDGPCVVLCMSSRENQQFGPYGEYTVDEAAARYGASSPEVTQETDIADASWPESQPSRYRDGWLP